MRFKHLFLTAAVACLLATIRLYFSGNHFGTAISSVWVVMFFILYRIEQLDEKKVNKR